eukprot:6207484-Pleurochrysis_carterae.AAC.1
MLGQLAVDRLVLHRGRGDSGISASAREQGTRGRRGGFRLDESRHADGGERLQGDQGGRDCPAPLHHRDLPSVLQPHSDGGLVQLADFERSGRAASAPCLRVQEG